MSIESSKGQKCTRRNYNVAVELGNVWVVNLWDVMIVIIARFLDVFFYIREACIWDSSARFSWGSDSFFWLKKIIGHSGTDVIASLLGKKKNTCQKFKIKYIFFSFILLKKGVNRFIHPFSLMEKKIGRNLERIFLPFSNGMRYFRLTKNISNLLVVSCNRKVGWEEGGVIVQDFDKNVLHPTSALCITDDSHLCG